jgi:SM-20-related protein
MPQPALMSKPGLMMADIDKFRATPLISEPFNYLIVPSFIRHSAFDRIVKDYPLIEKPGSFPLNSLRYGQAFEQLLDDLQSTEFQQAVEEKFSVDLRGRPTMITVRGMCGARDGKIHTDTESKIITLLIYMNTGWEKEAGRLRLLRSKNMEDVITEVPPAAGTMLMFRRSDNSYHGHKSYAGPRKVVQMNWVTEQKFADRNIARHGLSSWIKKLNPFSSEY